MNIKTYHKHRRGDLRSPFSQQTHGRSIKPLHSTNQGDRQVTPTGVFDFNCLLFRNTGFTIVELVVTIVIIGILASMGGMFISRPIEGYVDLKRRAELVDQAEMGLRRMQRDIRAALPNSIREIDSDSDGKAEGIEFLHVVDGGRYRRRVDPLATPPAKQDNVLELNQEDDEFEVLGGLMPPDKRDYAPDNCYCVIYNLNNKDCSEPNPDIANAYSLNPCDSSFNKQNIVKIKSIIKVDSNNDGTDDATQLILNNSIKFPYASPYQRFFIVDEAISYKIEGGELRRYSGYDFDNDTDQDANGTESLVAKFIDDANSYFEYNSGSSSRSGLVSMRLALESYGERISLLHQVHVDNAP